MGSCLRTLCELITASNRLSCQVRCQPLLPRSPGALFNPMKTTARKRTRTDALRIGQT